MRTIIFQGSGGTIGDIFFSSLPMYHIHKTQGVDIKVALPRDLNSEIKSLYDCQPFISEIIEMDSIQKEHFLPYAFKNNLEPHLFLESLHHLKETKFYRLGEWFVNPSSCTVNSAGCVFIQVMSTSHWNRPPIPHMRSYLEIIKASGFKPLFLGGEADEARMLELYPWAKDYCQSGEYWRFGKDTILETLANLKNCYAGLVFSSWTTYGGLLQGVPVLELWSREQWQFYTPMTRHMMGNPIHYLQDVFDAPPIKSMFLQNLPRVSHLASIFNPS